MSPQLSGVHHVTFVVADLDTGIAWFARVLGTQHVSRFDHHDEAGGRFGVVLALAGFPGMVELRVATEDYPLRSGYDPVTFEVPEDAALDAWFAHVKSIGVDHSPIKRRRTGRSLEITSPDGILLRLFTAPDGGFDAVAFQEQSVDH